MAGSRGRGFSGVLSEGGPDRRALIAAGLGGALSVGLGAAARAAAPPPADPQLSAREIADGVSLITGAGMNVVAVRGPDGPVLVDGGLAEHAPAVVDLALRQTRSRKVDTLFNTAWRLESTGANDLLGPQGTRIIAHENTRLWMGTEIWVRWEGKTYAPRAKAARPNTTFYTTGSLTLGHEKAEFGYLPQAHTDGDIYVFFRKANVLVCGGMLSNQGWPLIDWATGGWIGSSAKSAVLNVIPIPVYGGMNPSLLALIDLADDKTIIVPGKGPVMTRAELKAQSAMYTKISERLRDALYAGKGPSEVIASTPTREFDDRMGGGDPTQFVTLAFQSIWGHLTPDA
jgi:glyoxylase-like metal-dependent hydrolase (beta-lactamase superfamily II)